MGTPLLQQISLMDNGVLLKHGKFHTKGLEIPAKIWYYFKDITLFP